MLLIRLLGLSLVAFAVVRGAHAGQDAPAAAQSPVVRVLEQGEPPLRTLRYSAKVGDRVRMVQRQRVTMSMSIDGEPLGANEPPTMIAEMVLEVVDVDLAADRMTCNFRVSDTSIDEDGTVDEFQREAIRSMWEAFRLEGSLTFDSRGRVIDSEMKAPDAMPPEVRQLVDSFAENLSNLVSPLPEEPVGVRSTWEVVSTSTLSGIVNNTRALFTVDRFDGNLAFARSMVDITSPETVLPSPGPGVAMRLVESKGTGEASMIFDFSSPMTTNVETSISVRQLIEVTSDFGVERLQQDISVSVEVASAGVGDSDEVSDGDTDSNR